MDFALLSPRLKSLDRGLPSGCSHLSARRSRRGEGAGPTADGSLRALGAGVGIYREPIRRRRAAGRRHGGQAIGR